MFRKNAYIFLAILACVVLVIGAYTWAMGMMDSLYAYRSPLHDNPPSPGPPLGDPLTRQVVFVLVDALREDTSLDPEVMPFLKELRAQGAWATMHSRPPSYSAPGYSVLFTGAWPELSDGPALNLPYDELYPWTQDNLVSALRRIGLQTAISGFNWFEKLIPQEDISISFYTAGEDQAADRAVVDAALSWLQSGEYEFVFIHLDQVDYAGHHVGGPQDPRWDAAAARVDDLLGEIVATLDLRQDTLFIASDHGQIDRGGHGGQDAVTLLEPFVLAGAGVVPGHYPDVQMVDVAPTLAALLGANLPAASQGHVRAEMLNYSHDQQGNIQAMLAAQQSQLLDAYQSAIGEAVAVETGDDPVAVYQSAMDAARRARLNAERLPRLALALGVILLLGVYLYFKRPAELGWLFGAAFVYQLVFNIRYGLIDRLPYSLSWVTDPDTLIAYVTNTAFIALGLAWLMATLRLKVLQRRPRRAAEFTLSLTLMTVSLLLLPVLWSYVLDGASVTWELPDFASMYLGFIALLQILSVSALGILLTGLSALIALFFSRR